MNDSFECTVQYKGAEKTVLFSQGHVSRGVLDSFTEGTGQSDISQIGFDPSLKQGSQYCSSGYVGLLRNKGIEISMPDSGYPYGNALAEQMNGILNGEFAATGPAQF